MADRDAALVRLLRCHSPSMPSPDREMSLPNPVVVSLSGARSRSDGHSRVAGSTGGPPVHRSSTRRPRRRATQRRRYVPSAQRTVRELPTHAQLGRRAAHRTNDLSAEDPLVRLVVRRSRADVDRSTWLRPGPSPPAQDTVVGATRPDQPSPGARARAAGCCVDVVGLHQHAVHPDRPVRLRRLRDRRRRLRRRSVDRPGRNRDRPPVRDPRRPDRPPTGDPRRRLGGPDHHGAGGAGTELPGAGRHPGGRTTARTGARSPDRRGRHRGDAAEQPCLCRQRDGDGERARCRDRRDGTPAGRSRGQRLAARLRRHADLAGRRRRHLASAARDRAVRATARHRSTARPETARHAGRRRRVRQRLRGAGERLPEPLPARDPGVRCRDDLAVHAHHRHTGGARFDPRRAARRFPRTPTADRHRDPHCDRARCSARSW